MEISNLIKIRRHLHQNPELSNQEKYTSEYIYKVLEKLKPDKLIKDIGGNGILVQFDSGNPGKSILLRADIDALPINETNNFEHKSNVSGVAHKCGHDGHSAIMIGVASAISQNRNNFQGVITLLFQPAEETAEGAYQVLHDDKFNDIEPDMVFGLHNLPGYKKHSIIIKYDIFASASKGMIIELNGKNSHAAHPEDGIYPINAFTSIINMLNGLPQTSVPFNNAAKVTVINALMGERAFGTTPGFATIMATFRSHNNFDMDQMTQTAEKFIEGISSANNLQYSIEYVEDFPGLINNNNCVEIIKKTSIDKNFEIIERDVPFPWSEDFSYYSLKYPSGFFGIGSGIGHPQLHNNDYDFPDEIIETGIIMFTNILKNANK